MSRSLTAWSYWVSLVECSRSSFILTIVCRFLLPSIGDAIGGHQWEVQALNAEFHSGACCRFRDAE
jgi:hypothetical protein